MFEKLQLKVNEVVDRISLRNEKNKEFRKIDSEKRHINEVDKLDKQIEIEDKRAELRKAQNKNPIVQSKNQPKQKGMFESFQDFATNFSKQQGSAFGDSGIMLGGFNGTTQNKRSNKNKSKRSRKRAR